MVTHYDVSSFFESSGNVAAEFGENLRDSVVTFACDIWETYPSFMTKGRNPTSSFARGYMNSVCSKIQRTPPPINTPDFSGGQCVAAPYDVTIEYTLGAGQPVRDRTTSVFGSVRGGYFKSVAGGGIEVGVRAGDGTINDVETDYPVDLYNGNFGNPDFVNITAVVRTDGNPDDCGDLPPSYPPETPPTFQDLSTTININNLDGVDNSYEVTWNQVVQNQNFPFNFKVNGVNVSIDLSGLTIYGDPGVTSSNNNPDTLPPGSNGGRDQDGNPYIEQYDDQDFPSLPEVVTPELVEQVLEYAVCELGVIELVEDLVKLPPGFQQVWQLLLTLLGSQLEELCELPSDVGLPEIFPVLPGVDRPIIMYYFKEVENGVKGSSTYVSTLPNPSSSAINEIETVSVPDRTLGRFVESLKLLDGSRVLARGVDENEAGIFFNFLLSRVDASFVPSEVNDLRITTENKRLAESVAVKCTQIEYYPDGKSFSRTPSVRRIIDVSV